MYINHIFLGDSSNITSKCNITAPYIEERIVNDSINRSINVGVPYGYISIPGDVMVTENEVSTPVDNKLLDAMQTIYKIDNISIKEPYGIGIYRKPFGNGMYLRMNSHDNIICGDESIDTSLYVFIMNPEYELLYYPNNNESYPIIHTFLDNGICGFIVRRDIFLNKEDDSFLTFKIANKQTSTQLYVWIGTQNRVIIYPCFDKSEKHNNARIRLALYNPKISQGCLVFKDQDTMDNFMDKWSNDSIKDELFNTEPYCCVFDSNYTDEENYNTIKLMHDTHRYIDNILLVDVKLPISVLRGFGIRHASYINMSDINPQIKSFY